MYINRYRDMSSNKIYEGSDKYYRVEGNFGDQIDYIEWYKLDSNQIEKVLGVSSRIIRTPYLHGNVDYRVISKSSYFIVDGCSIQIDTSKDEWFLITVYGKNFNGSNEWTPSLFMCDQIDGLLDAVKFLVNNIYKR